MIYTEHEIKYILTSEEYNYLVKLFEGLPQKRALQTNIITTPHVKSSELKI